MFNAGDRYPTRASTVVIVSGGSVTLIEQAHHRSGVRAGAPTVVRAERKT